MTVARVFLAAAFTALLFLSVTATAQERIYRRHVQPGGTVKYLLQEAGKAIELPYRSEEILESLYLAGDPGDGDRAALDILREVIEPSGVPSTVVFLGDLIYPAGLPETESRSRKSAERVLRELDRFAARAKASVFGIPGNHDWADERRSGYEAILRLAEQAESIKIIPERGCPGPQRIPGTSAFSIIALDTQWWLHPHQKPSQSDPKCRALSHSGAATAHDRLSQEFQRQDLGIGVIAMHHPLLSYGPHGIRNFKNCIQDLKCKPYQDMKGEIVSAVHEARPLICAAGHEHVLEILELEAGCKFQIISGTMSSVTHTKAGDRALFSAQQRGFIRIDLLKNNEVHAVVFTFSFSRSTANPVFSLQLHSGVPTP